MCKIIDLKYFDAINEKNTRFIFNCDKVAAIVLMDGTDTSPRITLVIHLVTSDNVMIVNFSTIEQREEFLDILSSNLINTKSDGYLKIDLT